MTFDSNNKTGNVRIT